MNEPQLTGAESPRRTVLVAALVAASCLPFAAVVVDDAFVFARYAANLLGGHWFQYNPEGPRVEGFSSWLWLMVYVAGQAARLPPLVLPRVTGIALAGASAFVLLREIGRDLGPRWQWPAALMLISAADLQFFAASAMDHVAWAALAFCFLSSLARQARPSWPQALIAGAAIVVRPEGFLLLAPLLASERADPRRRWAMAALVLGMISLLVITRLALFHMVLPCSVVAKHLGGSPGWRIVDGARYISLGAALYGAPAVLCASLAPAGGSRLGSACWWFVLPSVALILLGGGDDTSAFGDARLWVPLILPLSWIVVEALARANVSRRRVLAVVLALAMARGGHVWTLLRASTDMAKVSSPAGLLAAWTRGFRPLDPAPLSTYLQAHTAADDSIAVPWAGQVPFETGRSTVDMLGLNEPRIARSGTRDLRGLDVAFDVDWVLDQRPRYLCDNFHIRDDLHRVCQWTEAELRAAGAYKEGQRALLRSPRLALLYEIDAAAPTNGTCLRRKGR